MKEPGWALLMEVYVRYQADILISMLAANGIDARQVQEAYENFAYRFPIGRIQILVPDDQVGAARKLYESSNWNFDATELDEDEEDTDEKK